MESYAGFIEEFLKILKRVIKKVFDSGKVSDHFAIIPTGEIPVNPREMIRKYMTWLSEGLSLFFILRQFLKL